MLKKMLWTKEKDNRVKFNTRLSANRPLNNWALIVNFSSYVSLIVSIGFLG